MPDEAPDLSVIKMPTDDEKKYFLYSKLNTYMRRGEEQGLAYRAPEAMSRDEIDTHYKTYILTHLIVNDEILPDQMSAALAGPYGLETDIFYNAWIVIDDYATTGGEKARAGKSWNLPPEEDPPN
ncbi:MAG: hypothetical protein IT410_02700 [Candidatus Doudnabacteria bacterium]|nr:hypothetical protein [Candidatus Doudnabacteria bacterium]